MAASQSSTGMGSSSSYMRSERSGRMRSSSMPRTRMVSSRKQKVRKIMKSSGNTTIVNRASKLNQDESAKFWAHVEKIASEVASWPEWKRGELLITAPEAAHPERVSCGPEGDDD